MSWNQNSGYGQAHLSALLEGKFGKTFVVMNTSDPLYDRFSELFKVDEDGEVRFFSDLQDAYDATVTNRNDTILLSAYGEHTLDAGLLVSKNRVHFKGLGAAGAVGQRARVGLSATGVAADTAYTLKDTGVGNTYEGIKFTNTGTHANSVTCADFSGEATNVKDCSFMKLSDLNVATVSDVLFRADSAEFDNCEFGFSTLTQSAARPTLSIAANGTTRAKNNKFRNCYFVCQSSEANKNFILVANTSSVLFENVFTDCTFVAAINATGSAVTLTNAVASVSGLVEGNLLFARPVTNCTNFCAGVTDNVKVVAPAVSNNAFEGVVPA